MFFPNAIEAGCLAIRLATQTQASKPGQLAWPEHASQQNNPPRLPEQSYQYCYHSAIR
jgi:hypothetical protein